MHHSVLLQRNLFRKIFLKIWKICTCLSNFLDSPVGFSLCLFLFYLLRSKSTWEWMVLQNGFSLRHKKSVLNGLFPVPTFLFFFLGRPHTELLFVSILTAASLCFRVSLKPPTNRPTDHWPPITDQPTTDQMHQPRTNRPPTSKTFEDQK